MTALLTREPCETCETAAREVETGAPYCRIHGVLECPRTIAVEAITSRALQVAAIVGRASNSRSRSFEAALIADSYAELCDEYGAQFDIAGFMAACNASRACAECRTREVAEEYHGACAGCAWEVAA